MNVEAYILIGGESKRFGTDKAVFEIEGESLAKRAERIASEALDLSSSAFVAARPYQFSGLEGRTITDVYAGRGAIGAIHAALVNAEAAWIFILACDLPFVTARFISHLGSQVSEEWEAVVPVEPNDRPQALCAFYRVAPCLDAFEEAAMATGKVRAMKEIIASLRTKLVDAADVPDGRRALINVNTPADLDVIK